MSSRQRMKPWLLAAVFGAAAACSPTKEPATEVVVEVQSELDASEQIATVDIDVRDAADALSSSSQPFVFVIGPSLQLPFSFAVAPATSNTGSFVVVATALDANKTILSQAKAKATFHSGKVLGLELILLPGCALQCGNGMACAPNPDGGASSCGEIPMPTLINVVPPKTTARGDAGNASIDGGGTHDGGTLAPDSGMREAGVQRNDGGKIASDGGSVMMQTTSDSGLPIDAGNSKDSGTIHDSGTTQDAGSDGGVNPMPIGIGLACNPGDTCANNASCVDGVCCKTACTDACSACNVPGSEGTCSPLPNGSTPLAGHGDCGPDAESSCQRDGSCDGNGACAKWSVQTVCKAASCDPNTNTFTAESKCDGTGTCNATTGITCAPFACKSDQTACYATCTAGGPECSAGNVCNGSSCGLKVNGSSCSGNGECMSTHCADGVCCDSACTGLCQACDISNPPGMCTTITSGQPHPTHGSCIGVGTVCGGQCGGSPTACSYTSSSTSCRSQSCSGGVVTNPANCNGSGSCPSATMTTCTPPSNATATCSGAGCSFTCNSGYVQSGNSCVPCGRAGQACCGGPLAPCVAGTACGSGTCNVNDLYIFGWAFDQSFAQTSVAEHYNGSSWGSLETVFTGGIQVSAGWATAPGNYYAIGGSGSLAELSSGSWFLCGQSFCNGTGTTSQLGAIYGFGANDIWIASDSAMLHYNGSGSWASAATGLPSSHAAEGFWGTSSSDLWFTGGWHYGGSSWTQSTAIGGARAFWGAASNDVWAVGSSINHWGGSSWSGAYAIGGAAQPTTVNLLSASGSATDDVWAVGYGTTSMVAHWDGSSWTDHTGSITNPGSVWVASKKQAWLTSNSGVFFWNGSSWSQVSLPALPSNYTSVNWVAVYGSANGH